MEDLTELFGIVERLDKNGWLPGLQKPYTQGIGVYEVEVLFS